MKAVLTSSLGGSVKKADGRYVPSSLFRANGLIETIQKIWIDHAKVLILFASPNRHEKNDSIFACFQEAFSLSGLAVSSVEKCDDRNPEIIEKLPEMDVIILTGGHVPTQNRFLKQLRLKERLSEYRGIVLAWSAGSMNCAEKVYAGPELDGEAIDPHYERWIDGLGLTKINVFPHYQALIGEKLDGLRLIEDITLPDSMGHEFVALNDGSYIFIEDGQETLYGEAYLIKDGQIRQICGDRESVVFK